MPIPASELEHDPYLRLLWMGIPKTGSSTHAISTSPPPVRVLLCESDSALRGAKRETDQFDFERIRPDGEGHIWDTMMKHIIAAKRDAKEGKIKTVVVDPLSFFAHKLLIEVENATKTKEGNIDGRKAHPEFTKRIIHAVDLMMTIPAHLVVVTHHMDVGGDDNADKPKTGPGIVPLMPNMATRTAIASMFYDIVWFDVVPPATPGKQPVEHFNNRIFVTGPGGAWGTGCRSRKGNAVMPAHVGQFIDHMTKLAKTERGPSKLKLAPR